MKKKILFRYSRRKRKIIPIISSQNVSTPKPFSKLAEHLEIGSDLKSAANELQAMEFFWKRLRKSGKAPGLSRRRFASGQLILGGQKIHFTDNAKWTFEEGYGKFFPYSQGKKITSKKIRKLAHREIRKANKIMSRFERKQKKRGK